MTVECDIIGEGHDKLAAVLRWRGPGDKIWTEAPMRPLVNDRWAAEMPLPRLGIYHYTIETWRDVYATFVDELSKKSQGRRADHAGVAGGARPWSPLRPRGPSPRCGPP